MQISAFRLINPMMTTVCKHQPISWMSWHQPNVCGCKRYALSHHVRWHVTEGLKYNTGCSSNIHDTGKMLNKKDNITFSNKWWSGTPFIIGKNTYRTGVVSLYLLAKWITVQFVEDDIPLQAWVWFVTWANLKELVICWSTQTTVHMTVLAEWNQMCKRRHCRWLL